MEIAGKAVAKGICFGCMRQFGVTIVMGVIFAHEGRRGRM